MSLTIPFVSRKHAKHRGKSGLQLQRELADAERRTASLTAGMDQLAAERDDLAGQLDATQIALAAAGDEIAFLRPALTDVRAKQGEAEELVVRQQADIDELIAERDELLNEVLRFRARFGPQLAAEANANRVDVPPMQRIGADQSTESIDVRALWDARDAGLLGPVTDPGHITTQ